MIYRHVGIEDRAKSEAGKYFMAAPMDWTARLVALRNAKKQSASEFVVFPSPWSVFKRD
jgi:hypothetical protein